MSVSSNNTQLEAILAAVNALPEAGGSSTPETCTVTIEKTTTKGYIYLMGYSRLKNGNREDVVYSKYSSDNGWLICKSGSTGICTINDVIVGSILQFIYHAQIPMMAFDANSAYSKLNISSAVDPIDPNTLSPKWLEGPIGNGGASWPYSGINAIQWASFKILGNTTIQFWDAD